jgi:hypothetical protein
MQHLVNALATLATKLFDAMEGVQGEIGGFDRQAAQIAGFGRVVSHLNLCMGYLIEGRACAQAVWLVRLEPLRQT